MWDPSSLSSATTQSLPFIALLVGLAGSLHCVGMCGPLALSAGQSKIEIAGYQLGRLCGYLLVGVIIGLIGTQVSRLLPLWTSHLVGAFLGLFFLYMGINVWRKKDNKLPTKIEQMASKIWAKLMPQKNRNSFLVGALSIFLPCGLLYAVFLGLLAFQNHWYGIAAIFFFWLGTVPAMVAGPKLAQKIFSPLASKFPMTISLLLMGLGMSTIIYRSWGFVQACH